MARPRSITDDEIKEAARDVFVEHGPSAPVKLVAQKLGVSHAALFGHLRAARGAADHSTCGPGSAAQNGRVAGRPPRPRRRCTTSPTPRDSALEILIDLMELLKSRIVPTTLVVLIGALKSQMGLKLG